jgi:hypothetical protein
LDLLVLYVTRQLPQDQHQQLVEAGLRDAELFRQLGDLAPLRVQLREAAAEAPQETRVPWWNLLWTPRLAWAAALVLVSAGSWMFFRPARTVQITPFSEVVRLAEYDRAELVFPHPGRSGTHTSAQTLPPCRLSWGTAESLPARIHPADGAVEIQVPTRLLAAHRGKWKIDCGDGPIDLEPLLRLDRHLR